jgi:tRNA-uridine 2-sulfurtransferase
LQRDSVAVRDLRFTGRPVDSLTPVTAQTRAHGTPVAARLDPPEVRFERPQSRVAPGQVVALYDGDVLLGGGLAA